MNPAADGLLSGWPEIDASTSGIARRLARVHSCARSWFDREAHEIRRGHATPDELIITHRASSAKMPDDKRKYL